MDKIVLPTAKCRKCGYEWHPRTQKPVACPGCQHRDWAEPKKKPQESPPE